MVRVRKTLQRFSKELEPLIDMHIWNDLQCWETLLRQYMQIIGHVDSLWIGEGSVTTPTAQLASRNIGHAVWGFSDMLVHLISIGMLFGSTGRFGCANQVQCGNFGTLLGL